MRRNIRFKTKMKILNCYVFSILNYGCESWTWSKAMRKKVNAFEFWCYRRKLKISWRDKVKSEEILKRLQKRLHFVEDMMKRKLRYAGHMLLRGLSGLSHLQILEGYVAGKQKSRQTEKNVDEGYYRMDRFGRLRKGKESCGGEKLEAHSCRPLLSLRR